MIYGTHDCYDTLALDMGWLFFFFVVLSQLTLDDEARMQWNVFIAHTRYTIQIHQTIEPIGTSLVTTLRDGGSYMIGVREVTNLSVSVV